MIPCVQKGGLLNNLFIMMNYTTEGDVCQALGKEVTILGDEEVYTVAGFRLVDFTGQDKKVVRGRTYYLSKSINTKLGEGVEFEKAFFSDERLATMSYKPAVGDAVEVLYNRFGRVYLLRPVVD